MNLNPVAWPCAPRLAPRGAPTSTDERALLRGSGRALVPLFTLALLCPSLASAYTYNGHRWPSNQVPFYVNVDSCTGPSSVTTTLIAADVLTDIQTAAFAWHDQTNANLSFVYAGTTTVTGFVPDGSVTVFCVPEPDFSGFVGQIYWWFGGDGNLFDFDIAIETGNYPYITSNEACDGASVYVLDVAIHEFGHGLSLGHSADVNATMYQGTVPCATKDRTLYSDDIAAIEAVYGLRTPPDVPPPALVSCTTGGVVYPIGSFLSSGSLRNGAANGWLTARLAEGWVLYSTDKSKGFSTLVVVCGLGDFVQGQGL